MLKPRSPRKLGLSLAELLLVMGVIALLMAIIVPALQQARLRTMQVKCMAHQQQLGRALAATFSEHQFFPLWDDGGTPIRYTWIDVLVQMGHVNAKVGYCPNDGLPDPLNEARAQATERHLLYPLDPSRRGVDYSFGLAAPLSAGGWANTRDNSDRPRVFANYQQDTARRILAADGNWSMIFNLSSEGALSQVWNDPTQFGNTVGWRHGNLKTNLLFQDGHVAPAQYRPHDKQPIDTIEQFVWYPGEPINLNPDDSYQGNWYPYTPPPNVFSDPPGDTLPAELIPRYYTVNQLWTEIEHK
jgi:prepilin-type processing-associated H-X9-DG protein